MYMYSRVAASSVKMRFIGPPTMVLVVAWNRRLGCEEELPTFA